MESEKSASNFNEGDLHSQEGCRVYHDAECVIGVLMRLRVPSWRERWRQVCFALNRYSFRFPMADRASVQAPPRRVWFGEGASNLRPQA